MTDSDEKKERESIDEERREWLKKLGIGAGAAAIGSGVLGFQAGRASAYNPLNRTVYGENIQNLQSIGTSTEPVESINTEQALIENNESVYFDTGKDIRASVVADDGTIYALHYDGSNTKLIKSSNPRNGWTDVYDFGVFEDRNLDIHITASGTILIGFYGGIRRSTDGGNSFTEVQALTYEIWSFTENSSGTILAGEYGETIWKSTDDGQTWSSFATQTSDFPNFGDHIHKVKFHPNNDWIIVTGGDVGNGYYRSTDGGTSWDWIQLDRIIVQGSDPRNAQFAGIACHPTKDVYFLGGDPAYLWRVKDDGTDVTDSEIVYDHTFNNDVLRGNIFAMNYSSKLKSLIWATGESSFDSDWDNTLYLSKVEEGFSHKVIAPTGYGAYQITKGAGAYEQLSSKWVFYNSKAINTERGKEEIYGSYSTFSPLDGKNRTVQNDIVFSSNDIVFSSDTPQIKWFDGTVKTSIYTLKYNDGQNQRLYIVNSDGEIWFFGNGDKTMLVRDGTVKYYPQTSAPPSPEQGDMVMADGTTWNPGSGSGFYVYDGGAWNYLGGAGTT